MNKQIITKVSVLIDKLSYISNNNDFNNLNKDNIDFNLLKSYSKELYELLNSITGEEKQVFIDKAASIKKTETQIGVIKPIEETKPIEIAQKEEIIKEANTTEAEEGLQMKPITDNIFDTVNSIKKKSKISRLNRLQFTENEVPEPKVEHIEEVIEKTEPIVINEQTISTNNEIVKEKETKPSFVKEIAEEKIEQEEENLSLNDRFKQPTESVADKVGSNNYKNLKELIDINDRFLFIQKLFGGSYLAFEESVNQINSIDTYSEALDYIDYKIKSNFDWDSNADEVARFLTILEKKYN